MDQRDGSRLDCFERLKRVVLYRLGVRTAGAITFVASSLELPSYEELLARLRAVAPLDAADLEANVIGDGPTRRVATDRDLRLLKASATCPSTSAR